jgi:hypothetical protein
LSAIWADWILSSTWSFVVQEWESCEINVETGLNGEYVVGDYAILDSV